MNVYIYDLEVFAHNWLLKARRPDHGSPWVTIWDDAYKLQEWLNNEPDILGGFNNKHYDDYIIMTILAGGDNATVKRCNDYIIGGGKPWEFPFLLYQRKPFKSFDLRDDIPDPGISLKAIEGNLKLQIVESSVPFDLDRPLTEAEKKEVELYCEHDVDSTVRLYWERKKNYLDAKILAGSIYGIDPLDALGYTNAKLSAVALEAKYTERSDERAYVVPERLPIERIPKIVLDFFMQITDETIPNEKLFGSGKGSKGMTLDLILKTSVGTCPVTYAWGGVHGAKPCVTIQETDDRVIINQDVGSLYPNSMINFGYTSRSMADPEAYEKLVKLRLDYKSRAKKLYKQIAEDLGGSWVHDYTDEDENGNTFFNLDRARDGIDSETYEKIVEYMDYDAKQSSLKLIINTCYGAMLSTGNGLNDRLGGRSVCITNQIAMSILISDLGLACETIDFVNINTDGIMFTIDRREVDLSEKIVAEWCELTGFTMERDDFYKVIQKDVNNYIGIYKDGHFKTKGGYVSLYDGGSFKTNSLQIIHKAIVDYLVKGVDPEITIRACTDVTAFQQIVKTGGSYEGAYHYIDGERVPIQKVNRVYAVKDPRFGAVVKGKWIREKRRKNKDTGKMESTPVDPPIWSETIISECPDHTGIDNENALTVSDLDLDYYIDMARKRIDKYIKIDSAIERKIDKINKEVALMATKTIIDPCTLNVYGKLMEARKRFLASGVKKQGVNTYAGYDYFRLEEIIPVKTQIFADLGLADVITFGETASILTIYNVDDPCEMVMFTSQLAPDESLIKNPIQKIGAVQTYVRRYLYVLALDIIEGEAVEIVTEAPEAPTIKKPKAKKPATVAERREIAEELTDTDAEATKIQITGIKKGLKKLRSSYMNEDKTVTDADAEAVNEPYIREIMSKIKSGITKAEAEAILIEIGDKVKEL